MSNWQGWPAGKIKMNVSSEVGNDVALHAAMLSNFSV